MTYPDAYLNHYAEIEGTKMKIEIDNNTLAAMKLFAATKDVRYYLNGLLLEIGRHESRLVGTNGHMMAALRIECDQPPIREPVRVILPNDGLTHVKKKGTVTVSVGSPALQDSSACAIAVECGGVSWSGLSIDGRYPDWRRIVPASASGDTAQFDPHYMTLFQDAAALLARGKTPMATFAHNGNSPAIVDVGDENFIGVLMPWRAEPVSTAPAWASCDVNVPSVQVAA